MDGGAAVSARRILHVGCGGGALPSWLGEHIETRLDIDPRCKPDIVASILEMGEIGEYEGVYSSHCLEHVYPHQVPIALSEMKRALVQGGVAVIIVPDLEDVKPTNKVLYQSPSGPICGLDIIYGHRASIETFPHMAHHIGFTKDTLHAAMEAAGFADIKIVRMPSFNLLAKGIKP